jgi:hypothetical protein
MLLRPATFGLLVILALSACSGSDKSGRASPNTVVGYRFIRAPASLLDKCKSTARRVGYAVPCPTRVPARLVAFGGTSDCTIDIIGPGKHCPNTRISWRGWVVGSSVAGPLGDQHLVLTASPLPLHSYARVVNGPAWFPSERVRPLGWVTIQGWRMREVYVPPSTNVGSAFASHAVLIWTAGGHTYGIGFHNVKGMKPTLALDITLARGIKLIAG